jgi:hypothetical protein
MNVKSRFFKDTQGLGECYTRCPPDQLCICLRMSRTACGQLMRQAARLNMTTGRYIQLLLEERSGLVEERSGLQEERSGPVEELRVPVPAGCSRGGPGEGRAD